MVILKTHTQLVEQIGASEYCTSRTGNKLSIFFFVDYGREYFWLLHPYRIVAYYTIANGLVSTETNRLKWKLQTNCRNRSA